MNDSVLKTTISRETVLTGTIDAKSPLEIYGRVKGPVNTDSDARIFGEVEGDVHCGSLTANGARIKGDILCAGAAVIGNDCIVSGSIQSESVTVSGEVVGNLTVSGTLTLTETAVVAGDIVTEVLEVGRGAIVRGKVAMERAVQAIPETEAVSLPEIAEYAARDGAETLPEKDGVPVGALAAALDEEDI